MIEDAGLTRHRALIAAVELGSMAAAADRLGYSVSSVSRMVADLEAETGLRLLERGRRGVSATAEGAALLPRARALLAASEDLASAAAGLRGLDAGVVRIGTIASVAAHVLPGAMGSFRREHPGIDFELLEGDYAEITQWLAEGRVGLGTLRAPAPAGVEAETLVADELVAVLPRRHPFADAEEVPLAAFEGEPFIDLRSGGFSEVAPVLEAAGVTVRRAFSTWDDQAVMAMVEAGLGLAVLPGLVTRRRGFDVACPPLAEHPAREILLARRAGTPLGPAAEAFRAHLRATGRGGRDA